MDSVIDLKAFKIYLPDGDSRSFYIYGDFVNLYGLKYSYEAVKKNRNIIKFEIDYKPVPTVHHETAGITTRNPEVLFKIVQSVNYHLQPEKQIALSEREWNELYEKLKTWKAPKPQKWKLGDVFSFRLMDNSYVFGQVIGEYPTIALFDFKCENEDINLSDLQNKKVVTIFHTTNNDLANWTWHIIGNVDVLADKDSGPKGHDSLSPRCLQSIANYYWFSINGWASEDEMKKMIMIK